MSMQKGKATGPQKKLRELPATVKAEPEVTRMDDRARAGRAYEALRCRILDEVSLLGQYAVEMPSSSAVVEITKEILETMRAAEAEITKMRVAVAQMSDLAL